MLLALFVLILIPNLIKSGSISSVFHQPEQIHIAYGSSVHELVITWSTFNNTKDSIVEYKNDKLDEWKQTAGSSVYFVDGGPKRHSQYVHSVALNNLDASTVYTYHCGSTLGWSSEFSFKTAPLDESLWQPSFAIFGDMGNVNAQSLPRLQKETQDGLYDAILHVGDFAYDMDSENALVGDAFMQQIQPIAAYIPYMTCPGNHEERYNFSNYLNRFNMPGEPNTLMYSFNIGPLHIISISTEVYYFINYGIKAVVFQYEWLENDLRVANLPENRAKQPWIIVMGHRPMYCSNSRPADCANFETYTRVGLPFFYWFGLEKLFYDNGVDVEIWAHEHSYERLWPVYDYKIFNGSYEKPYVNPGAPVHIITGSAGCDENHSIFNGTKPYWSAFRSTDYGYTRMKAYNKTHLYFEQVSDEKEGAIIDWFWLVKDTHGSYV